MARACLPMQPFDQPQCLIVGMLLGTVRPVTTTSLQDNDQAWFINQAQLPTGKMDKDILVECFRHELCLYPSSSGPFHGATSHFSYWLDVAVDDNKQDSH